MTKITFIGDVHGKVHEYKKITDKCEFSICVGDFGFQPEWGWFRKYIQQKEHRCHVVNMGNHDYIPYVNVDGSCGNHSVLNFNGSAIFTVRGADSIDKHLRIEGLDWFANEELNYQEQLEAFDEYVKVKPEIVVSHDCPQSVMEKIFKIGWSYGKSQTRTMLHMMFQEHQPKLWVFGHHHQSKDVQINGTRFVCLNELETMTLEL
jgi:Icc-related predicted phosphoesterase